MRKILYAVVSLGSNAVGQRDEEIEAKAFWISYERMSQVHTDGVRGGCTQFEHDTYA